MDELLSNLNELLDTEKYDEARQIVENTIQNIALLEPKAKLQIETNLYGFLTDIGIESQNEEDLNSAISFFETNEKELEELITKSSYYYNLANAKGGLSKIFYSRNKGVHSISITKEKLQEPINLYWLAYKTFDQKDKKLLNQILINLSNSLVIVNRIVEGLQFLDLVLKEEPNFSQALISRADNLLYLSTITNCPITISLYYHIYLSYDKGIKTKTLPPTILNRCEYYKKGIIKTIENYGFEISNLDEENEETLKEYNQHSNYRKYSIDNFLTLNEHGIYCKCFSNSKDDIQIGVKQGAFKTELVPKLELLLNRIKSEFGFARWMFYKSNVDDIFDYDVRFSELLDGEIINSQTEYIRTSFRICYGILDKIALGICKLYNLESKLIHFHSFWDDKKRKIELDKVKNIHLNAIYSIACDLNATNGELKEFKNWRNKLEHNLLILKNIKSDEPDILKLFEDEQFVAIVDIVEFTKKTLHLLQLTRSAIFSFVYCIRLQTIEHKSDNDNNIYFNIDFKRFTEKD